MIEKTFEFIKEHSRNIIASFGAVGAAVVLLHFYYRSNLPLTIVYENSDINLIFMPLLLIAFVIIFASIYLFLLVIQLIITIYFKNIRMSLLVLIIAICLTVYEFFKMSFFTPFFSELYLEIYNSPKVFKSENGHFYTVFTEKDNVYKGYDLNKSLNNSSKRCEEILKLQDHLPSVFIYQLINKQTDDNYTIPYNISEIDANLTQIEFEDALSSIQSYCKERSK